METTAYKFSQHDLGEIFKSVWGYTAAPFLFSLQNKAEAAIFKKSSTSEEYSLGGVADRREYNLNGVPFYALNENGNEIFMPIWLIRSDGSRLLLQNTIMSLASKKTIVETPLVNRKGTVKEEISVDDWEMNVKGVIVSSDGAYPDQQVYDLNQLYELGEALGIENARTSLLLNGGEKVVIKTLDLPPINGKMNVQAFEMNLVSDLEFSLFIE